MCGTAALPTPPLLLMPVMKTLGFLFEGVLFREAADATGTALFSIARKPRTASPATTAAFRFGWCRGATAADDIAADDTADDDEECHEEDDEEDEEEEDEEEEDENGDDDDDDTPS